MDWMKFWGMFLGGSAIVGLCIYGLHFWKRRLDALPDEEDNEWLGGGSTEVEDSPMHRAGRHGIGLEGSELPESVYMEGDD